MYVTTNDKKDEIEKKKNRCKLEYGRGKCKMGEILCLKPVFFLECAEKCARMFLTSLTPLIITQLISLFRSLSFTQSHHSNVYTRAILCICFIIPGIHIFYSYRFGYLMLCVEIIESYIFCHALSPNHAQSTLGKSNMQIISKWITIYIYIFLSLVIFHRIFFPVSS